MIDLSNYSVQDEFTALPAGEYEASIFNVEMTQSKSGNQMLKVTFKPVDGAFKNYQVFDHFVIGNQVAMERLRTVSEYIGLGEQLDPDKMRGKRLIIKTKIDAEGYAKVKGFKRLETKQAAPAQAQAEASEESQVKPPWES